MSQTKNAANFHQIKQAEKRKEEQDNANRLFARLNEIREMEYICIAKAKEFAERKERGQTDGLFELGIQVDEMCSVLVKELYL